MKYSFLLVAIFCFACSAFSKDKSKPLDLTGTWKEARRMTIREKNVDFSDTVYYEFLVGNEYTTQRKNGFMYKGTYKITPGLLDLGMRAYSIIEMNNDRMILKDDAGIYRFERYEKPQQAENNSAAASATRGYKEGLSGSVPALDQLNGRWEVYKRTSSATLQSVDYSTMIQMVDLRKKGGDTLGSVAAAKDMEGTPSWTILRYENGILFCSGPKGERQLRILSAKPDELIIEEAPITYFFKQFR